MPVSGTGRSYYIDFMSWIKHRSHYARQTHGAHSAPARSWKCVIGQKTRLITLPEVHCHGSTQWCVVWTVLKQERRYLNKHAVLPKKTSYNKDVTYACRGFEAVPPWTNKFFTITQNFTEIIGLGIDYLNESGDGSSCFKLQVRQRYEGGSKHNWPQWW